MESKPSEEKSKHVLGQGIQEDVTLEELGYQQELRRSYGLLDMLGFSFSIVTCWSALSGVFIIGVSAGGPPVVLYGWIGTCVLTMAVACAMAEMCSRWPVAGGQYSWVALMAPEQIAREMSYVTGWFMLMGIISMGSANNSFISNYILGQANLVFPQYTIERWQSVLVSYLAALIGGIINIWTPHLLYRLARAVFLWNMVSFVVIVVVLLATNDHKQSGDFVFHEFQNGTGFGTAMATIIGILQAFFGMCCYDTPVHMTEEMTHPSRDAPRAIILSVVIGAVTGFVFLITLCFCIGDISSTADTSTGSPVLQVFYDSTNSKAAACFMASMITVIMFVSTISLITDGSRSLYAFARDHGLPFSGFLSQVSKKKQVPVNAIVVTVSIQMAFNSIYFGTVTGFNTVVSIATTGFYVSYALALLARILGYFFRDKLVFTGPYSLSLPISLSMNMIGFFFLVFAFITFNFPSEAPVNESTMNYTSAAIGVTALLSLVTWFTTGNRHFHGPVEARNGQEQEQTIVVEKETKA
ncbi:putative GABA permease [Talaromyces proteolyticus]|uniref:GABA permease n=1 Tax=Talaromyces proteolyticus TaxID=1131652 RepID=A0AAD4KTB5_9EURO|nr:putative GABA permease [Talaromyces proteolyticus]KAH8700527.1 putative GABA permease [Talaromyces proteolyticus]